MVFLTCWCIAGTKTLDGPALSIIRPTLSRPQTGRLVRLLRSFAFFPVFGVSVGPLFELLVWFVGSPFLLVCLFWVLLVSLCCVFLFAPLCLAISPKPVLHLGD